MKLVKHSVKIIYLKVQYIYTSKGNVMRVSVGYKDRPL